MKLKQTFYIFDVGGEIIAHPLDMSGYERYTLLDTVEAEIEYTMPDKVAVRDMKIAKLRDKISEVRADSQQAVCKLEDSIQKLMAVEA